MTLLMVTLLASPAVAQVTPSAVTGPASFGPYGGPNYLSRGQPPKVTAQDPEFQRETAALQRDMAEAQDGRSKLSSADRAVFKQRYVALLQRYGYPVPRMK